MSCSEFKSLSQTLQELQVTYVEADFIQAVAFDVADYFRQDLQILVSEGVVANSEYAIYL